MKLVHFLRRRSYVILAMVIGALAPLASIASARADGSFPP
jgi:hypothetical protein